MALPGATKSGFICHVEGSSGSPTGPRETNDAITSSDRRTVPRLLGAPRVERAHCQGAWRVARGDDGADHRRAVFQLAQIARSGDDDDARLHSLLDGFRERIVLRRSRRWMTQRQIDDADVVFVLVLDRPI